MIIKMRRLYKSPLNIRTGQLIKEYREKMDYTQKELADISGYCCNYIARIEMGDKGFSLESLLKISNVLGISIETFEKDKKIRQILHI